MRPLLTLLLLLSSCVYADNRLEFTVHKLDSDIPGPTILVVGGIQGDEPGGFHAASLLVTNYKINRGRLWVVPNLNFESIVGRSRGLNGDMNRKFAYLQKNDPDYNDIQRIKSLIKNPEIDFIFNMHDGSGFYRTSYHDKAHNPYRWGQSIIIDQEQLEDVKAYSNIGELAKETADKVNHHLLDPEHVYHVRNTRTREGDKEMEKTLTYFAINNGKAAVGLEASKSLPTAQRAYYHLNALENFFTILGLDFQRNFVLSPKGVNQAINENIQIAFYQNKFMLDIAEARSRIGYVPFRKDAKIDFTPSNPLIAITPKGRGYKVNYGNRDITYLHPQFFDFDDSLVSIPMEIDGIAKDIAVGTLINVEQNFEVMPESDDYRVNVIGWTKRGVKNEAWQKIYKNSIGKRFSIDRNGDIYRVELYKGKRFCGMVLVRFNTELAESEKRTVTQATLPMQSAVEQTYSMDGR